MSATEKHQEFTKELIALLTKFHEENPDLFVVDISVLSEQYMDLRWVCLGVRVGILAQPTND